MNILRKIMLTIVVLMLCVAIVGCSNSASFSLINPQLTDPSIQGYMQQNSNKNGVYLYQVTQKNMYLFLNSTNVDGGKVEYFEDIDLKVENKVLTINITKKTAEDSSIADLPNSLLYQIKVGSNYDTIKLVENGSEISFDDVKVQ